jgi:hypothetical protein
MFQISQILFVCSKSSIFVLYLKSDDWTVWILKRSHQREDSIKVGIYCLKIFEVQTTKANVGNREKPSWKTSHIPFFERRERGI